jgi:hypothetical protein
LRQHPRGPTDRAGVRQTAVDLLPRSFSVGRLRAR